MFNKQIVNTIHSVTVIFICLFYAQGVQADIFKCTNMQGKVVYIDKPCKGKENQKKMRPVADPKNIKSGNKNESLTGTNKVDDKKNTDDSVARLDENTNNTVEVGSKEHAKIMDQQQKDYNAMARTRRAYFKAKKEKERRDLEAFESQLE